MYIQKFNGQMYDNDIKSCRNNRIKLLIPEGTILG